MKQIVSLALCLCLCLCATSVAAQPRQDFMNLFAPDRSNLDMSYMYAPDQEADDESDAQFDLHLFNLDLEVPIPLSPDTVVLMGGGYGVRHYDYSDGAVGTVLENDVEELHRLSINPGIFHFVNRQTTLAANVEIGAFSNLDGGFKSGDVQVLGDGMLIYNWTTNFQWVVGAAVSEDFESANLIPLLGFRSLQQRWHYSVTLPREAKVTYTANNVMYLYGGAWLSGSKYRVRSDDTADFTIHTRDTRIGAGLDYRLFPDVKLTIEAGALIGKDAFEVELDSQSTPSGDLDNSAYARMAIGVNLR